MSSLLESPTHGQETWSRRTRHHRLRVLGAGIDPYLWLPLAVTLPVTLLGILLVFLAKTPDLRAAGRGLAANQVRDLSRVRAATELEPMLGQILERPAERRFVAEELFRRLRERSGRRFADVDAIAGIRIAARPVAERAELGSLSERARGLLAAPGAPPDREMTLLTGSQVARVRELFVVRTPGEFQGALFGSLLLYLLAFAVMHFGAHARGREGDRLLLPAVQLLSGLGLIVLVGLRDPVRDALAFQPFCQGALIGAGAFVLATLPRYERTDLGRLAFVPWVGALALSLALLVLGQGPRGTGAKVNLFGFQPIEMIRLMLVLFLAGYFARRWEILRALDDQPLGRGWLSRLHLPRRHHFLPVALGIAVSVAFSILQRDLGPALLLLLLFLALYTVSRGRAGLAAAGFLALCGLLFACHVTGFPSTVSVRTAMWLSPWENGLDRGIQLAHAAWAFAAGGWTGTGPGLGSPAVVPAVHTDLILAAIGEELGLIGVLSCVALYALLIWRGAGISARAPGDYAQLLALGLTLNLGLEALLIAGGTTGVLPLTGVVLPFVSYGRSAQIVHFAALGMLWSLSAAALPAAERSRRLQLAFDPPRRWVTIACGVMLAAIAWKALDLQLFRADSTMAREALERQGDGELRYRSNPRLLAVQASLARGDILDRNGVLLATSHWSRLEANREPLERFGIDIDAACTRVDDRHYPFGGLTWHLLGDGVSRARWGAPNAAFVERRYDAALCGFDDRAEAVTIHDPRTRTDKRTLRRDLSELVPMWRHRRQPRHPAVRALFSRERDLRLTIDIRLQGRATRLLREELAAAGLERGAVAVLDPASGELLASVSLPAPEGALRGDAEERLLRLGGPEAVESDTRLLDRARYGSYPPGSTFKIVTAAAALENDPGALRAAFTCRALPGGKIGTVVGGRRVHDDSAPEPHGTIALAEATAFSCNAYYAQLGERIGWTRLAEMSRRFGIEPGRPGGPSEHRAFAIESAYGQAEVVATPLEMARVAAVVAAGGRMAPVHWVTIPEAGRPKVERPIEARTATLIGGMMRQAVERGTARRLAGRSPRAAGKTGTAQISQGRPHAWFIGYAPHGPATRRVAVAVLLENGGAGGYRATDLAGRVMAEAAALGLARAGTEERR